MPEAACRPDPEDLSLLAAVIRDVARNHRLSASDREEFAQTVQLRFLERKYEAFARFRGDSSLRTYLNVVVSRLLLDWRIARHGKWRPSAAARRLGPQAVSLDRLMNRDGYTRDEAVEIARRRTGSCETQLSRIADQLPRRPRPRLVDEGALRAAPIEAFSDPVEALEEREDARRRSLALALACRTLSAEERRLIALRYRRALTVREISRLLDADQKALYRRFDRVVSRLRVAMLDSGVGHGRAPRGA